MSVSLLIRPAPAVFGGADSNITFVGGSSDRNSNIFT